eukprot:535432-Pyramimonas_sp.AAC.1
MAYMQGIERLTSCLSRLRKDRTLFLGDDIPMMRVEHPYLGCMRFANTTWLFPRCLQSCEGPSTKHTPAGSFLTRLTSLQDVVVTRVMVGLVAGQMEYIAVPVAFPPISNQPAETSGSPRWMNQHA